MTTDAENYGQSIADVLQVSSQVKMLSSYKCINTPVNQKKQTTEDVFTLDNEPKLGNLVYKIAIQQTKAKLKYKPKLHEQE